MSEDGYRFGFNGKENDRDFGNDQLVQDYGFRVYNPALGKFLSVDPLTDAYPWYTPYQFAGNKVIWAIDLDGLEEYNITSEWFVKTRILGVPEFNDVINNVKQQALLKEKLAQWVTTAKFPDGSPVIYKSNDDGPFLVTYNINQNDITKNESGTLVDQRPSKKQQYIIASWKYEYTPAILKFSPLPRDAWEGDAPDDSYSLPLFNPDGTLGKGGQLAVATLAVNTAIFTGGALLGEAALVEFEAALGRAAHEALAQYIAKGGDTDQMDFADILGAAFIKVGGIKDVFNSAVDYKDGKIAIKNADGFIKDFSVKQIINIITSNYSKKAPLQKLFFDASKKVTKDKSVDTLNNGNE